MEKCCQEQQILKTHLSGKRLTLAWGGAVLALIGLASCASLDRTVTLIPDHPGAEFVGSEDCLLCHEELGHSLDLSVHSNIVLMHEDDLDLSCESCHGPGSFHSNEGGGSHLIHNPGENPETCLRCHQAVQGEFMLPSHHPLESGLTTCTDCHFIHSDGTLQLEETALSHSPEENCSSCHQEQAGPYTFEHEALREGCTACHAPHGSINDKMLKVRNASLCLQCHFSQPTSNGLMIGEVDHSGFGFIQSGTCWTAGCHEAVHGSHVNGSLRF